MPCRLKVWTQVCHILLSSHLYCQFNAISRPNLVGICDLLWFKDWTMILHEKHPRTWDMYSNPSSWTWTVQTLQPHEARLLDVWVWFCFVLFPYWQLGSLEIRHWNCRGLWSKQPIIIRVRMGPSGGERGSARAARPERASWRLLCCNSSLFSWCLVENLKTLMPVLSVPLLLSPSPSDYLPLSLEQEFRFNLATSGFLVPAFFSQVRHKLPSLTCLVVRTDQLLTLEVTLCCSSKNFLFLCCTSLLPWWEPIFLNIFLACNWAEKYVIMDLIYN